MALRLIRQYIMNVFEKVNMYLAWYSNSEVYFSSVYSNVKGPKLHISKLPTVA